jgi:hypothetical protein
MRQVIVSALERYVKYHIVTGSFLRAVLENDFMEAILRADDENLHDLLWVVHYVVDNVPVKAYGSKDAVKQWLLNRDKV